MANGNMKFSLKRKNLRQKQQDAPTVCPDSSLLGSCRPVKANHVKPVIDVIQIGL
jgi:hypothetical protein